MNLPNKLTTFRVILIPFFVFFMLAPNMTGINHYIAAAIFIVASLTDLLAVSYTHLRAHETRHDLV